MDKILIDHINQSVRNAENGISKLSVDILRLDGMSNDRVRHFLNNICSLTTPMLDSRYLEIGCWKGSTFVSALYGNESLSAIGIDNWSEFGGPKDEFLANYHRYITQGDHNFYSEDCFALTGGEPRLDGHSIFTKPINIYFYDGNHEYESHELALTYYDDILADLFILIVDDWNWDGVKTATKTTLKKLGHKVLYELALPGNQGDSKGWWNGLYVALISKV